VTAARLVKNFLQLLFRFAFAIVHFTNNEEPMSIETFKRWMKEATPFDKSEVARLSGTSLNMLYQLTYETRKNGKPMVAGSDLAGRIAAAIGEVNARFRHKPLPVVGRGDLSTACGACPYYANCGEYKE
jgi:hypothetical protein